MLIREQEKKLMSLAEIVCTHSKALQSLESLSIHKGRERVNESLGLLPLQNSNTACRKESKVGLSWVEK